MKKSELKQHLREEIKKTMNEGYGLKIDDKLKKKLKVNGFENLIKPLEMVKSSGANQMAGGIKFVYDNWDVAPNGEILIDIIEYLKSKAKDYYSKP